MLKSDDNDFGVVGTSDSEIAVDSDKDTTDDPIVVRAPVVVAGSTNACNAASDPFQTSSTSAPNETATA